MMLIQYVSLGGSLIFLLIVFLTIYRGALREGYALLWIYSFDNQIRECGNIMK